jgi:hypothetical protein
MRRRDQGQREAAEKAIKHGKGVTGATGATGPTGPGPSGPTAPTGPTGGTASPQTIDVFTVTPSSILSGSGDAVVITWATSNATSVTLNGLTVAVNSSTTQHPNISGTYTLIAFGSVTPVSITRTFTVILPQTVNAFTASPAAIALGATSSLSWSTSATPQRSRWTAWRWLPRARRACRRSPARATRWTRAAPPLT